MSSYREITHNGLWKNNPGLVQLLGLCPLLATSSSVVNGLGMGLATIFVLAGSNFTVSAIRNIVQSEIRLPVFVMVIAAFTTATELIMQGWFYGLYQVLGIFIPLITTNCVIIGRAEAFACKQPLDKAALDGLMMGLGFTGVLVAIGAIRELLGRGSLLHGAELLFGPGAADWSWQLAPGYDGLLLAVLPPGAFIVLGLLIALKNVIDARLTARPAPAELPAAAGA